MGCNRAEWKANGKMSAADLIPHFVCLDLRDLSAMRSFLHSQELNACEVLFLPALSAVWRPRGLTRELLKNYRPLKNQDPRFSLFRLSVLDFSEVEHLFQSVSVSLQLLFGLSSFSILLSGSLPSQSWLQ